MPSRNGHRYLEQDWGNTDQVQLTAIPRPTELDRRTAQRVVLQASVSYGRGGEPSLRGEGQLINLSKKGCRIAGNSPVSTGKILSLSLRLSDGNPPLCLHGATVCWMEGNTFGVKFAQLTDEERQRLQHLVWKFASRTSESEERTAFRFA